MDNGEGALSSKGDENRGYEKSYRRIEGMSTKSNHIIRSVHCSGEQ